MNDDPNSDLRDGASSDPDVSASPEIASADLRERIVEVMKSIFDPEIPVNIYELGMVYDIEVDENAHALVRMTLTSPACPVAGTLPGEVEVKLNSVEGIKAGKVELVWEPPWTPDKMSEAAKLQLGMM